MKLKIGKVVRTTIGLVGGLILGYIFAVCWLAWTGNLMMPLPEYERKAAELTTIVYFIVGFTGLVGALLGFLLKSN